MCCDHGEITHGTAEFHKPIGIPDKLRDSMGIPEMSTVLITFLSCGVSSRKVVSRIITLL